MPRISLQTLDFIKKWEGFNAKAYQCSAGIWTIGYGTTIYSNGIKVKDGDVISREYAECELCKYIKKYCLKEVYDIEKAVGKLNDNQKTAIISLVYNIGCSAFSKSKCKYYIMNSDSKNACKHWNWYCVNNEVVKGLVSRRNQEIELFYGIKNFWKI